MSESNNKKHPGVIEWIAAARIRTLPLALAVVGMGNFMHFGNPEFRFSVFFLSMVTTVFLQILSNFANDLGDSEHGADHAGRRGPARLVQQGKISRTEMKKAALVMAALSLVSGLVLLAIAFFENFSAALPLFVAGLMAIAAAWFYTNGKNPYGYQALGDLSVFLFFGLLAVIGSSWLQIQIFLPESLLAAAAAGFWSVAVLNLNNMRDMDSDHAAGKLTVPLLIGRKNARFYQIFLVMGGIVCLLWFGGVRQDAAIFGAVPGMILMLSSLRNACLSDDPALLDKQLKPQALGTFFAVFGLFLAAFVL